MKKLNLFIALVALLSSSAAFGQNVGYMFVNDVNSGGSRVLRTTNGGNRWLEPSPGSTYDRVTAAAFITTDTGYMFVNDVNSGGSRVLRTTNGGNRWLEPSPGSTYDRVTAAAFPRPKALITTSIEKQPNLTNQLALNIFPNPTDAITNLVVEEYQDKAYSIMNIMGQEVMQGKIQGKQTSLDLSTLETKGTYLVLVRAEKTGQVLAKKLVTYK